MANGKIHDEPSSISVEGGAVRMRGPEQIDVRFTPEAAEETSERLLEGSMRARGQRYFEEK